jgi:hypothetical protein
MSSHGYRSYSSTVAQDSSSIALHREQVVYTYDMASLTVFVVHYKSEMDVCRSDTE